MQEFGRVIGGKDPALQAGACYNLGNAFFRQQKLQEAVEAYKKSLELKPDDIDAKINLELAQEMLKQQQQQQGKDDRPQEDREQSEQKQQSQKDEQQQDGQDKQDKQEQEQGQGQGQQQKQDARQQQGQQQEGRPADQRPQQEAAPREGEISKEEAQRLLDALKDREAESQQRRRIRIVGRRYTGNEW